MDGEGIKPNPSESGVPGPPGEPIPPSLPKDADQVLNRATLALKEKKELLVSTTQSSIDSAFKVYISAFQPQSTDTPPSTQTDVQYDHDTISRDIDNVFAKDAPTPASQADAEDYLGRIDALAAQLPGEIAAMSEEVHGPDNLYRIAREELNKKNQELQDFMKTGMGGLRNAVSFFQRRAALQREVSDLQRVEKDALDGYSDAVRQEGRDTLSNQLIKKQEEQADAPHLKVGVARKFFEQATSGVIKEYSSWAKGIGEEEGVQEALFIATRDRLIKPQLATLVRLGEITPEKAEAYVSFLETEFQTQISQHEVPPSGQERTARMIMADARDRKIEWIDSAAQAVHDKTYTDIFKALAREEVMTLLSSLPLRAREYGLSEREVGVIDYHVKHGFREELADLPSPTMVALQTRTRTSHNLWEVVRDSPLADIYSPETWTKLDAEIAPEAYNWWVDGTSDGPFVLLWSAMKNNPDIRKEYLPRAIAALGTHTFGGSHYGATLQLYDVLNSLTPEDLQELETQGFSTVSQLKALAEQNPTAFHEYWMRDPTDPTNREKWTRNPVRRDFERGLVGVSLRVLDKPAAPEDNLATKREGQSIRHQLSTAWRDVYGDGTFDTLWDTGIEIDKDLATWALVAIRSDDRIVPYERKLPPPETRDTFHNAVNTLRKTLQTPDLPEDRKQFLQSEPVLRTLGRQPQRVEIITDVILHDRNFDRLTELMSGDGPLAVSRDAVLEEIFSSGKPAETIQEIIEGFNQKKPYFEFLFEAARRMHGVELHSSDSNYPITEVATREGVIGVTELVTNHKAAKTSNSDELTQLEEMVSDTETLEELVGGERTVIPFSKLHGMWKEQVFRTYLRQCIEFSRTAEVKQRADIRNRGEIKPKLDPDGVYLHGTAVDNIDAILLNGNLPSTVLGADPGWDVKNFPFHSEFIRYDRASESGSLPEFIEGTRLGIYGSGERHGGALGDAGQMFLVYDRNNAAYEGGKDCTPEQGGWPNHRIMLGGMPSTEISAIILRDPSATSAKAMASVVENGFYIPIYDFGMNLIWTPEQFEEHRKTWNLGIEVPVWDYTFKVGEARGSHTPAGEYALPLEGGGTKKYYVKFAEFNFESSDTSALQKEQEERSKIWNEFLANRIYQHLGIPVANTDVVKVNRSYGYASQELTAQPSILGERPIRADARTYAHVSEWIDQDETVDQAIVAQKLKDGFIVDALLGNWDITKEGNVVTSGGEVLRVDNGGALLFRARGERKTPEEFNQTVSELDSMRSSYQGITEDDIQSQVSLLQDKFRDEDIDVLVDSTRLHETDRNLLKQVLRQRRNYIIDQFSSPTAAAA